MRRSIIYNGYDFGEYTAAEVYEAATSPIAGYARPVVNTPVTDMLDGRPNPKVIRVRLHMDVQWMADAVALADVKRTLSGWLCAPADAALQLPDMEHMHYEEAFVTACGAWSGYADGCFADVEFTVYDPVAYGLFHTETENPFTVRGNWETWPDITVTAEAGTQVAVFDGHGHGLILDGTFTGGETVRFGGAMMDVHVDNVRHMEMLTTASEFFAIAPGEAELELYGCTLESVMYQERWV